MLPPLPLSLSSARPLLSTVTFSHALSRPRLEPKLKRLLSNGSSLTSQSSSSSSSSSSPPPSTTPPPPLSLSPSSSPPPPPVPSSQNANANAHQPPPSPPTTHYRITLHRSAISLPPRIKSTLTSLRIHHRNQTVYHPHSPACAGKILRVKELVRVENVPDEAVRTPKEQREERKARRGFVVLSRMGERAF